MTKPVFLTGEDQKLLQRIERTIVGDPSMVASGNDRDDICVLLASAMPSATPAFRDQLEARLLREIERHPKRSPLLSKPGNVVHKIDASVRRGLMPRWRRGIALAAVVLALVALTLTWIGPRRVWAHLQQWLGYVPGIGFVELDESRVLTAPVALQRGDVTLHIEQLLARPDGTTVVISSEGLPPEDAVWPHGARVDEEFAPRLHLPDGRTLQTETFTLSWGAGTLVFPALPDDVYSVTLSLPGLPLVPPEVAPEGWEIPLLLRSATGELADVLFPQPYAVTEASDTHQGVTLRVVAVAQSAEETAVRLQLQWSNPDWESHFIHSSDMPALRDDLGHVYYEAADPGSGSTSQTVVVSVQPEDETSPTPALPVPALEETLVFAPVSPSARRLTLAMGGFRFDVPAEAEFTVDLGDTPRVGDTWPLELDLTVDGLPVHVFVASARLVEEQIGSFDDAQKRLILQFDIAPAGHGEDIALCGLWLESAETGFRSGSTGGYDPQSGQVRAGLDVADETRIPTGVINVRVSGATLCLNDLWAVTWEVPGTATASGMDAVPVTHAIERVNQTRNGLTLQVEEVVLTDRLTGVKVALNPSIEGEALATDHRWGGLSIVAQALTLTDDRGRNYVPSRAVAWRPYQALQPDSATLTFGPLEPLARRLTLHVPAVTVVEPAAASFEVLVPDGLTLALDPTGPPWRVSEPWPVEIDVNVAEYRLRFSEARLEDLNGTTLLALTSEPYRESHSWRWLSGVRIAMVTTPSGREVSLETAHSAAGPETEGSTNHRLWLAFDVKDPQTLAVEPGPYQVILDGASIIVQGPWDLSWALSAP